MPELRVGLCKRKSSFGRPLSDFGAGEDKRVSSFKNAILSRKKDDDLHAELQIIFFLLPALLAKGRTHFCSTLFYQEPVVRLFPRSVFSFAGEAGVKLRLPGLELDFWHTDLDTSAGRGVLDKLLIK